MTMLSSGSSNSSTRAYIDPAGPNFFICAMSVRCPLPSFLKVMLCPLPAWCTSPTAEVSGMRSLPSGMKLIGLAVISQPFSKSSREMESSPM